MESCVRALVDSIVMGFLVAVNVSDMRVGVLASDNLLHQNETKTCFVAREWITFAGTPRSRIDETLMESSAFEQLS